MFEPELQFADIQGPTEIDVSRIPEFPASAALQSIEGQNFKGAAFDVLEAYAFLRHPISNIAKQKHRRMISRLSNKNILTCLSFVC